MNNIKIRAWDNKEKQMMEVGMWDMMDKTFYNLSNDNFEKSYSASYDWHNRNPKDKKWGDPEDLTLMLYSDKTDINGNRLCDGEIVMYGDEPCLVIYQESCFYVEADTWVLPLSEVYSHELELYGNKYENPDLIKGV